ncbi:MAG: T9SS type A sorting domain-containing protein [Saprospiraceae bacterium]
MKIFIPIFSFFFLFQNVLIGQTFVSPSSVAYDNAAQEYFVCNSAGGDIFRMDGSGNISPFKSGLGGLLSLAIFDEIVYVSEGWPSGATIYGFDKTSGDEVFSITLNGTNQVNDLLFDSTGVLFVSDRESAKIFKIDILNSTSETLVGAGEISGPNGMMLNGSDQIIVASTEGKIFSVNTSNGNTTLLTTNGYESQDGIAADKFGNIFISSWSTTGETFLFYYPEGDFTQEPIELFSNGFGMGDFAYNPDEHLLAIPNWNQNSITFYELETTSAANEIILPNSFISLFPNPIIKNDFLTIQSENVNLGENWKCTMINSSGKVIKRWNLDQVQNTKIQFNSSSISAGFYLLIFEREGKRIYKKMIVGE